MIWFCFRMNSVANLMIYKHFVRLQHVKTLKCRFLRNFISNKNTRFYLRKPYFRKREKTHGLS